MNWNNWVEYLLVDLFKTFFGTLTEYWVEDINILIMTTRINPPSLEKAKNYELFKQEVMTWKEITDLAKNKQGIAVALSLPEDDEHQIKDKVFDQIPLDDLKSDFGLSLLIEFLDKHLT